eukprot:CAMPEP_0185255392 /NCGR_PEP_ID=MMETSP1359-20130426/4412_1 /TAXON_ID=552665 /ORGANISM="Bigelowiella longifila, Strain CCMP242" /LENGTH=74 /DNA_ID=CAMNT_0027839235 /DNA_START=630 /DNA_END=851 /DNA_ORIENTATION=+
MMLPFSSSFFANDDADVAPTAKSWRWRCWYDDDGGEDDDDVVIMGSADDDDGAVALFLPDGSSTWTVCNVLPIW